MSEPNVIVAENTKELSKSVAKDILSAANENKDDIFLIALSGGSLPQLVADGLIEHKDTTDFSNWRVFFADERYVAKDHADSNYKASKESFLDALGIKDDQVYPLDDSLSLDKCAEAYENNLVSIAKKSNKMDATKKFPIFDVILLGMGPDGHTCSLFPGHPLLKANGKVVETISDSPKPPPRRITLTYPVLNSAKNVFFVAAGDGKKDMLPKVIISHSELQKQGEDALPSARVRPKDGKLNWYIDKPAAVNL